MRPLIAAMFILCVVPAAALAADTVPSPAAKAADAQAGAKDDVIDRPGFKTTVIGQKDIKESDAVGTYSQPVWTAKRRFPTTRVYVVPAGSMAIEYWLTTDGEMAGGSQPSYEQRLELEFGLGKRLQLDLYLIWGQDGSAAPINLTEQSIELRYAFADWGKLWGNPTLYVEWIRKNAGPQNLETKILLGDRISPVWFWGLNLVFQRALGGDTANEYAISAGVSRVVSENRVNLGLEVKAAAADVQGARFDFTEKKVIAGPSLQVKPVPGVHIDLTPMLGVLVEAETKAIYAIYFIIGKDL